jgi:hypothetical protein
MMLSQQTINIISKAQLLLECLIPSSIPLSSHKLIYLFLATESIKLYYRFNRFMLQDGILIDKRGEGMEDSWIKKWKGREEGLKYSEILAEVIHILRPVLYLIVAMLQEKSSYKALGLVILLDYLRTALQKPAETQV